MTGRELSSDLDFHMSSLSLETSSQPNTNTSSQPNVNTSSQPIVDTSSTAKKKKRRGGRSAETTWVHSRQAFPHEVQDNRYCIHCKKPDQPDVYHTSVSSNLRTHLKTHHNIIVEITSGVVQEQVNKQLEQLYLRAETSNQTEEVDTRVLRKVLDRERIHEAFVSLLVTANLSFRLVELPQFHAYNQTLNPEASGVVTTSHSHVATKVGEI